MGCQLEIEGIVCPCPGLSSNPGGITARTRIWTPSARSFVTRRHGNQTAVVSSAPSRSAQCSGPRWKSRAGMPIARSAPTSHAFCRRVPAPVRPVCHPLLAAVLLLKKEMRRRVPLRRDRSLRHKGAAVAPYPPDHPRQSIRDRGRRNVRPAAFRDRVRPHPKRGALGRVLTVGGHCQLGANGALLPLRVERPHSVNRRT